MTKDKTVTMSRELAESLLTEATNQNWSDLNQALNVPTSCRECMGTGGIGRLETCEYCKGTGKIANHSEEPLGVEQNKCGQCSASTTDICNQNGCGFLESGNGEPVVERQPDAELLVEFFEHGPMATIKWFTPSSFEHGATKVYTAPPELAELQATIARLETQMANALNLDFERRAEIGRLKGGQGEPMASEAELIAAGFGYPMSKEDAVKAYKASLQPRTDHPSNDDCEYCHGCGHDPFGEPCVGCCKPVSQPAPVSVALDPYPIAEAVRTALDRKACPNVWMVIAYEAVVDKVKELNQ